MSDVRLVVRVVERDWSRKIHESCADRAVAALSADPVTMDELEVAVARFAAADAEFGYFSNLRPGLNDRPYVTGLVVIDLVAWLIVVDSTYSSPDHKGTIHDHNGYCCTGTRLTYHLADDWKVGFGIDNWRWCSAWRRSHGSHDERKILSSWPVSFPQRWREWVEAPLTEEELRAVRRSVSRGSPFGDETWTKTKVDELRLQSTCRQRGRPNKPHSLL